MILEDVYCINCSKQYMDIYYRWCKSCQINDSKNDFTKWTSGNEKIDNLIQEMQLKIDFYSDVVFEWISYHQFYNIRKIGNNDLCLTIWIDGPLCYNKSKNEYTRSQNKNVALKYLNDSQNIINEV